MDTPSRIVPLDGASNFRDLGGYRGRHGRRLRWRRVFRSDQLGALTRADHDTLATLGVTRSFDFRGANERAAGAYALPGVRQHALTIEPTVAQRMTDLAAQGIELTPARAAELMQELYRHLVDAQAHRYAEWFAHLLDEDTPLVFHCTAGKDRTGVAAALLLCALGVDAAVIEEDYLLSNACYRRPDAVQRALPEGVLAVLWSVRAAYLRTAFDVIDRELGGFDRYLAGRLKLTPAARGRLEAMYLEPGAGAVMSGAG